MCSDTDFAECFILKTSYCVVLVIAVYLPPLYASNNGSSDFLLNFIEHAVKRAQLSISVM